MPWYPIAHTLPQYVDSSGAPYSGAVLKAYANGTSTNINLATDATGGTTASSMALNASGYPEVSGNEVIPHVDEAYKLSLYATQAAADADTGAIWTIDELTAGPTYDIGYVDDTGAADAYVIAPSPPIKAYAAGQTFSFIADNTNTGAATLNVSGLGAVAIRKAGASVLVANDIAASSVVMVIYDGTNFQLLSNLPASAAPIEATTRMLFQQTAAPTGWTQDTAAALNDVALRLTTGTVTNSTGNDKFSDCFGAVTTAGPVTLTAAQSGLPAHTHEGMTPASTLTPGASNGSATGSTTGPVSGGAQNASASHVHSMNLDYYEAIVCVKD
jgi:hypothetical protein